jgi:hypothetical protein
LSNFRDTHFINSKVDVVGWDEKRNFLWWRRQKHVTGLI